MENKGNTFRINISMTREQYEVLKSQAGQVAISRYIREKVFGADALKSGELREWVEFLSKVPSAPQLLRGYLARMKASGSDPYNGFYRKF